MMPSLLDPHQPLRRWIAEVLAGGAASIGTRRMEIDLLVDAAAREHVTALVASALVEQPSQSEGVAELRKRLTVRAQNIAGVEMFRHGELIRILAILDEARIKVLLLKGTALAYWLYPEPYLRECSDIDLLFRSRADAEEAVVLLAQIGYELVYSPGDLSYEMPCRRVLGENLRVEVDIHWKMVNAPVFADVLIFDELYSASIPLPQVGPTARGLSPVHALLHASINRAMNLHTGMGDRLGWLCDVRLLTQILQPTQWQELISLCKARGMCGICDEALRAAEAAFGLGAPAEVMAALQEQRANESLDAHRISEWRYMQLRNLAALPDVQTKVRWLWQRSWPSLEQLQARYGGEDNQWRLLWRRLRAGLGKLVE